MNVLCQLQLSNYDLNGKYILECDSNWNICIGRIRGIFKYRPNWNFYVIVPEDFQIITTPEKLISNLDQQLQNQIFFIRLPLTDHAFKTRYDFSYQLIQNRLQSICDLIDIVIINDPMLLKNYKSVFYISGHKQPKFICNSHFIDNPENPKVPKEISYWYSQVSAAKSADLNTFQCQAAQDIFFSSMSIDFTNHFINIIRKKSVPWDEGFSLDEIMTEPNMDNVSFELPIDKTIVFFPNRISQYSDYTNAYKFMNSANELYKNRQDFVVIFGNPSQKIPNYKLLELCKPTFFTKEGSLTRDEYLYVIQNSNVNVALYLDDSYGGCANVECIAAGCVPVSPYVNNYKKYFDLAEYPYSVKTDLSDLTEKLSEIINFSIDISPNNMKIRKKLRNIIICCADYANVAKIIINDIEKMYYEANTV